jgi:hypothetical protein
MELNEIIDHAWDNHHDAPDDVAKLLAENAARVGDARTAHQYVQVANHVVGDGLGDWPRAKRIADDALAKVSADKALQPALAEAAAACILAGDTVAGLVYEGRSVACSPATAVVAMVYVRAVAAESLARQNRWDEVPGLFDSAIELAESLEQDEPVARNLAITSNNVSNCLLAMDPLEPSLAPFLEKTAAAAQRYWTKAGTWQNHARADYMLAVVKNRLGKHDDALKHAEHGVETIRTSGDSPVDEAFLNLQAASAAKALEDAQGYARYFERAEGLAASFEKEGLKQWFATEADKVKRS